MNLVQVEDTGCRLVGAITELGHAGPKHHAVILGMNLLDGLIYVAEHMHYGYQVVKQNDFVRRYEKNGPVLIQPNEGQFDNVTVASRALEEIKKGGKGVYNLITNNCECFVNRAMHDKNFSKQIIRTGVGVAIFAAVCGGVYYYAKNSK